MPECRISHFLLPKVSEQHFKEITPKEKIFVTERLASHITASAKKKEMVNWTVKTNFNSQLMKTSVS